MASVSCSTKTARTAAPAPIPSSSPASYAQTDARASKCTGTAAPCQRHVSLTRASKDSQNALLRDLAGGGGVGAHFSSNSARSRNAREPPWPHSPYQIEEPRAYTTAPYHPPYSPQRRRKGTALTGRPADDKRARRYDVVHRPSHS
ncbi:hypothetical protein Q7P35_003838 [Cladosporium inversicolor]